MRFWDSSAVVPLLVHQAASPEVDRWLGDDDQLAVWTLTPLEVVSAIRRLLREGAINEREARHAEARCDELMRTCHVIIDVDTVKVTAVRLLRTHALRAGDALQLGAALEWSGHNPTDKHLLTFDARLALAGEREGFHVLPQP